MKKAELIKMLHALDASTDAIAWCANTDLSPSKLWRACRRGDWMLCLAFKIGVRHEAIVGAACACARMGWGQMGQEGRWAIKAAEARVAGEATGERVAAAATTANVAHAYAAAYAAHAVTAYAAAYVAANDTGARDVALSKCAAVVRAHISWADILEAGSPFISSCARRSRH